MRLSSFDGPLLGRTKSVFRSPRRFATREPIACAYASPTSPRTGCEQSGDRLRDRPVPPGPNLHGSIAFEQGRSAQKADRWGRFTQHVVAHRTRRAGRARTRILRYRGRRAPMSHPQGCPAQSPNVPCGRYSGRARSTASLRPRAMLASSQADMHGRGRRASPSPLAGGSRSARR